MALVIVLYIILLHFLLMNAQNEGYFWHVTDFHLDDHYTLDHPSCTNDLQPGDILHKYGNYFCGTPVELMKSAITSMKEFHPDPDFILWTGDTRPHVKDNQFGVEDILRVIKNVTFNILQVFPKTVTICTLGNHDYFPDNQLPSKHTDQIHEGVLEFWKDWIVGVQNEQFHNGGFYHYSINSMLEAVVLNTNLYGLSNKQNVNEDDPLGQFMWLEKLLRNLTDTGKRVLVFGHIAPGGMEGSVKEKKLMHKKFNEKLLLLLEQHSSIIPAMFFGHNHKDSFRILLNKKGQAVSSLFLTPAITPWTPPFETLLPKGNNPAIRLVKYDKTTGIILDFSQYYLNLTDANLNEQQKAEWQMEYRATQAYNISDLTASSLYKVIKQMRDNDQMFDLFYQYFSVNVDPATKCLGKCKKSEILCMMENMHYDVDCKSTANNHGLSILVLLLFTVFYMC